MSSTPSVNVILGEGSSNQPIKDRSITIVGQKTSNGSADTLVPIEVEKNNIKSLFGADSHIANLLRGSFNAFGSSRKVPNVYAICLDDDAAGTAATGEIAITGTATENGVMNFHVNGELKKYSVSIVKDETASQIGAKLAGLISDDTEANASGVNTAGVVAITAKNKGTVGNLIGLSYEGSVAGISVAITAMANGATDPSLTGLLDNADSERFTSIVMPSTYDLSVVETALDERFNVDNEILDGVLFVGKEDTYTNIKALGDSKDDKNLVIIGNKKIDTSTKKAGAVNENIDVLTVKIASLIELLLTDGSDIREIVSNQSRTGGAYFAGIPLFNTVLKDYSPIAVGEKFSRDEVSELKDSRITLMQNNYSNNILLLNTVFTTYRTNSKGENDTTYRFLSKRLTLSLVREYIFFSLKSDFAQKSLISDGAIASRSSQVGREEYLTKLMGYYDVLSGSDYALLISSDDVRSAFQQAIEDTLKINTQEGKISNDIDANIVSQLREIDMYINPIE